MAQALSIDRRSDAENSEYVSDKAVEFEPDVERHQVRASTTPMPYRASRSRIQHRIFGAHRVLEERGAIRMQMKLAA